MTPTEGGGNTFTIAGTPGLEVRADTEYVIDARKAERLRPPRVEGQDTQPRAAVGLTYARKSDTRGYTEFGFFDAAEVAAGRAYITPTHAVTHGAFETTFKWRLEPSGRVRPGAPDAYELLFNDPRFPHPLSPGLSRRDVAEVDTTYRPVGPAGDYRAPGTTPPLLMVDYAAGVDLLGRVDRRRPLRLDLRVRHIVGAAPAPIDALRLWWSADGRQSWERAWAWRTGASSFRAYVPRDALRPGGSVSLRAAAADAAGNTVDQTVLGIYPVR